MALSAFWDQVLVDLEELAGPLREVPAPASAFMAVEGVYQGRPVRAVWHGRATSGQSRGSSLHLAIPVGDRAIRSYVLRRKNSTIFGPTATTGDAAFDEEYVASARPLDVVSSALDGDVRAMIRRRWPNRDTSLGVADGWSTLVAATSTPGRDGAPTPPTRAELKAALDDLALFTDRLVSTYDVARASIVRTEGEASALAWEQRWREDAARAATKGRLLAVAIILVVLAIAAAVVYLVI
ncbi:MAG: hypothetical protein KDB21_10850 [Acidimicrobiales bacterium]|nr:hypothetical protein [Acidimicrobiales bacterium]